MQNNFDEWVIEYEPILESGLTATQELYATLDLYVDFYNRLVQGLGVPDHIMNPKKYAKHNWLIEGF